MGNMDDGFTKFPNIVLEALVSMRLSSLQLRTFLYIVRWTIGYKGMYKRLLSVSQMAKNLGYGGTGYSRQHVQDAVHDLEQMGMIKIGKRGQGAKAEFEIMPPECWCKHAPPEGQVEYKKEGQVTCPARRASHAPIDGQEHAPPEGQYQRNKDNIKESKRKENQDDQEKNDGEDPLVLWERVKHEYEHL